MESESEEMSIEDQMKECFIELYRLTEEELKRHKATPEDKDRITRLRENLKPEVPKCSCFPGRKCPPEKGPYYTQLGAAPSLAALEKMMQERSGLSRRALRFIPLTYTERKTNNECPKARWVIRRSSPKEKILCLVKHRPGHSCSTAWMIVSIVYWDGLPGPVADDLYQMLRHKLGTYGLPIERRCERNDQRNCTCQGTDSTTAGASFVFGCSWNTYMIGCKFARSPSPRKFCLSDTAQEKELEKKLQAITTRISPLFKRLAPEAYNNHVALEMEGQECRLGTKAGRPFSGITVCMDFSAHAHKDQRDLNNGSTLVLTLTRHRGKSAPKDEQLHVLPLYSIEDNESGSSSQMQSQQTPGLACPSNRRGKKRQRTGERTAALKGTSDPETGGVGIALGHGSVMLECAKHEMHATTSLRVPDRTNPHRISLVFYQHKFLNSRHHGWTEWKHKLKLLRQRKVKLHLEGKEVLEDDKWMRLLHRILKEEIPLVKMHKLCICKICSAPFLTKKELMEHEVKHHRSKKNKVEAGKKNGQNESSKLMKHLGRRKPSQRRVTRVKQPCRLGCCNDFSDKVEARRDPEVKPASGNAHNKFGHLRKLKGQRYEHISKKPRSSKVSNRKFAQLDLLKSHMRSHNKGRKGVETFACPVCEKRFVQSRGLKCHMTRKHPGWK